ncbi:MAG: hypothetical protein HYY41_04030 [Chloroflexi bacterium]|nr:hypothetical protein [Chloroflexota bacterium]
MTFHRQIQLKQTELYYLYQNVLTDNSCKEDSSFLGIIIGKGSIRVNIIPRLCLKLAFRLSRILGKDSFGVE